MESEDRLYELVGELESAWNRGDAAAFAARFADDADFIHILGCHFSGRSEIENGHRTIFNTIYKGSKMRYRIEKIRVLNPDMAVLFLLATLRFSLGGETVQIEARPTLVVEELAGRWYVVVLQNTGITHDTGAIAGMKNLHGHPFPEKS